MTASAAQHASVTPSSLPLARFVAGDPTRDVAPLHDDDIVNEIALAISVGPAGTRGTSSRITRNSTSGCASSSSMFLLPSLTIWRLSLRMLLPLLRQGAILDGAIGDRIL